VDDNTVPDDVQDLPIEGPEAEKAMEEKLKATREKEAKKDKDAGKDSGKKKDDDKDKEGLRGGTGAAGPLFQLPGDKKE
jgi:small subunit ribosomal protein S1